MQRAENCINSIRVKTPFSCSKIEGKNASITIVAPSVATVDGKKLIFKSWDGCSASNDNQKICRVDIDQNDSKKIKANYGSDETSESLGHQGTSTNASPPQPPTINCQSTSPDSSGFVTCSIIVYNAPLGYSFAPVTAPSCGSVLYDAGDGSAPIAAECPNGQQVYYWGTLSQLLHISCVIPTACDDYTPMPDHVSNLTDSVLVPTTLNIRVPHSVEFFYSTSSILEPYTGKSIPAHGLRMNAVFNKWEVSYDINRKGTNILAIMAIYKSAN